MPALDNVVSAVDVIYQATKLSREQLHAYTQRNTGLRRIRQTHTVIDLSDEGAEWASLGPSTQVTVYHASGHLIARTDLEWERRRVSVESVGDDHFLE